MGHKQLVKTKPTKFYPAFLKSIGKIETNHPESEAPTLIMMREKGAAQKLESLVEANPHLYIVDNYDEQYAELLLSRNAHLYRSNYEVQVASIEKLLKEHYGSKEPWTLGSWVFYPWLNQLVHILNQDDFEELRTIRNRDLITKEEQKKLFDFKVACFGMSVGSAGAQALSISGISRNIKLIDGAVISGSNLNRILTGITSVGVSKAVVIGRQIYEMNPYSKVTYFDKAHKSNIEKIFDKPWSINLAIDEIDDLEIKIRIRVEARKRRIPVIMATELGDTVMLDIERFDNEPNRKLFHGLIPDIEDVLTTKLESHREWMKYAVRIIDPKNMPIKMQKSLLKIGSTIVTHPQLGSTVMATGGVLAFAAKNIALNSPIKSGRYIISLEKELLTDHQTRKYRKGHKKHTKIIESVIKAM